MKYKIKSFDEINDIYLLYRQVWWLFYTFVGSGKKRELEKFVVTNGGTIV
jgi:hypothetical protein